MAIKDVRPEEYPQEYPDRVSPVGEVLRAVAFRPFIPAEVRMRELTFLPWSWARCWAWSSAPRRSTWCSRSA